jgi:hypothetical protein
VALIAVALFLSVLGSGQHWGPNPDLVDVPVDLTSVNASYAFSTSRSGDFYIGVEMDRRAPGRSTACLLGKADVGSARWKACPGRQAWVGWSLRRDQGAAARGWLGDDGVLWGERTVFLLPQDRLRPWTRYTLSLTGEGGATLLQAAHPRLVVRPHGDISEGAMVLQAALQVAAALCGLAGLGWLAVEWLERALARRQPAASYWF